MGDSARLHRDRSHLAKEEARLAQRAAAGERAAFDALFDRYYARLSWYFRDLPPDEARAAIWQTLEQLFASLENDDDLAQRAYRMARR
jgi:hypothetical protein